jgi:hypothetical protein
MIVTVLVGTVRPREKIFDAVIDKVESSPSASCHREIEHDNPEIRRVDELARWLGQLYNREVTESDTVTVIRFSRSSAACFKGGNPWFPHGPPSPRRHPQRASAGRPGSGGAPRAQRRETASPPHFPGLRIGPPKSPRSHGAPALLALDRNAEGTARRRRAEMPHLPSQPGTHRELCLEFDEVPERESAVDAEATQSPSVLRRSSWIQFRFGRPGAPIAGA